MGKASTKSEHYVKRQTLTTSVVVALMVGFFLGVVFGVYKSSGSLPSTAGAPAPQADSRDRMLQAMTDRVEADPGDVEAWVQIGNIHFDSGRPNESIEAYEKALSIQPGNAMVLTDLGIMYRQAGKPKEAIRHFEMAIEADPKLENPHYNKGVVLLHDLNDRQAAIEAWEGLLAVNPLAMAPNGQSVDELVTSMRQQASP
jgi:cytochrome c-type biogenesis protein CcmH/NrfG